MTTRHSIFIGPSQNMDSTKDNSIDLVVTSPPYPKIKMWDDIFAKQNPCITYFLDNHPAFAFEAMHQELDKVWKECYRVLKEGGFLCVNIGDATRTFNGNFTLFNNHARISTALLNIGFVGLPNIIWRKQTNTPNKFMGSGMLPCGAYVTMEHEWVLVFRKGGKRIYKDEKDKMNRMKSAFFWEERNAWFSDVWEVKGVKQKLQNAASRDRSAAFPLEIPCRLVCMFSQMEDTVMDPFLGTGTTMQAAILLGRNSRGYEIDPDFEKVIRDNIESFDPNFYNDLYEKRVDAHKSFVANRKAANKKIKHFNKKLGCEVMTEQEKQMELHRLESIHKDENTGQYVASYNMYKG